MVQSRDLPFIINLGNSIIGVSVLAIPFCFHQCGIILGSLLLFVSSLLTRLSCDILLRAANSTKKRTYEYLAHHTFGSVGKSLVEVSIIGLLFGTCIAFHVIVGDLSPSIVSVLFGIENTRTLRAIVMVSLAICVALPLSLMRNIQSLSGISAVSLGFYLIFILQIFLSSLPNLITGALTQIHLWKFSGTFHCLPIFLMAFTCQTQLFLVYEALPEPSINVMSSIVSSAVNMVSIVYFLVGFFGYTAFCFDGVKGDVLMNFGNGVVSALIKLGFVLSIVVSFPLAIFPCRASINSLLAKQSSSHDALGSPSFIPHNRFVVITVCIMTSTLIIGILIPQVEIILALTGAIMGTLICYIVPGAMFLHLTPAGAKQRQIAKIVLVIGLFCLVMSSFTIIGQLDVKKAQPRMQVVNVKDKQDKSQNDDGLLNNPMGKDNQKANFNKDSQMIDNNINKAQNNNPPNNNKFPGKDKNQRNPPVVDGNDVKKRDTANNPDDSSHLNNEKSKKDKDSPKKGLLNKEETKKDDKKSSKFTKDQPNGKISKAEADKNLKKKTKDDQRLEPIAPEDSVDDNQKKMIKSLEKKVQDLKDLKKSAEKSIEKSEKFIENQDKSDSSKKGVDGDNHFQKGNRVDSDNDVNLKSSKNIESSGKNMKNGNSIKDDKVEISNGAKDLESDSKKTNLRSDQLKKQDSGLKQDDKVDTKINNGKNVKSKSNNSERKDHQVSKMNSDKENESNNQSDKSDSNDLDTNNKGLEKVADPQRSKSSGELSKDKGDKVSKASDSANHKSQKAKPKDSLNAKAGAHETDGSADGSKTKSEEHHLIQKEKELKRKEVELKDLQLKLKEVELRLEEKAIDGKIKALQKKAGDLKKEIIKETEDEKVDGKLKELQKITGDLKKEIKIKKTEDEKVQHHEASGKKMLKSKAGITA
ncbi:putative sodium-coupled neutral amino acid transporter 10 [Trichoplax sp. H2]|nr:putative sodium-coupled neutral amino acid transporter 10 [Trichoplax sp. H2]|eukprot:RDD43925.1 putative sodium-coupled neutral amino acid transporter 10 [Trichoplax sp. H2]